jgi:hypothetical protein
MKISNKKFNSPQSVDRRIKLFRDGFLVIKREEIKGIQNFINFINKINNNSEYFELQSKQKGCFTLKNNRQKIFFFVDFLFSSGLIEKIIAYTGIIPYLSNYKHYLNKGSSAQLGWHRDTYSHKKNFVIGTLPSQYKLAIYSSSADKNNACMQILSGTHKIDFNNKYIDKLLALIRWRRVFVDIEEGDAIIFESNILHNRTKAFPNSFRSATIYSLARSKFNLSKYYNDGHKKEINRYLSKLSSLKSLYKL